MHFLLHNDFLLYQNHNKRSVKEIPWKINDDVFLYNSKVSDNELEESKT